MQEITPCIRPKKNINKEDASFLIMHSVLIRDSTKTLYEETLKRLLYGRKTRLISKRHCGLKWCSMMMLRVMPKEDAWGSHPMWCVLTSHHELHHRVMLYGFQLAEHTSLSGIELHCWNCRKLFRPVLRRYSFSPKNLRQSLLVTQFWVLHFFLHILICQFKG